MNFYKTSILDERIIAYGRNKGTPMKKKKKKKL